MPRNLPNGRQEYNVALDQEKITVIEQITEDLTDFLMKRCTTNAPPGLIDIYMNSALSPEAKEAAVKKLQAEERERIIAAYAEDKESLSTPELTQAHIFALETFKLPGSNSADLIALFHDVRAKMPSCYGYFSFEVINDITALKKEDESETEEVFFDEIEHKTGEGPVVTHSERRRLSARD